MRKTEIDEDRKLNDRNENERQREALFDNGNDDEYRNYRYGVHNFKIVSRCFDHILHAGGFADQHCGTVIAFDDRIQAVYLIVDFVARNLILRVDEKKLPTVAL